MRRLAARGCGSTDGHCMTRGRHSHPGGQAAQLASGQCRQFRSSMSRIVSRVRFGTSFCITRRDGNELKTILSRFGEANISLEQTVSYNPAIAYMEDDFSFRFIKDFYKM